MPPATSVRTSSGVGFQAPERAGYAKFAQRASRFALVGVFVAKTAAGVRVAVTGAGACVAGSSGGAGGGFTVCGRAGLGAGAATAGGSGATTTHAYQQAGTFTVVLTVASDNGQSSTSSRSITISAALPANAAIYTFSPTAPAINQDVVFTAQVPATAVTGWLLSVLPLPRSADAAQARHAADGKTDEYAENEQAQAHRFHEQLQRMDRHFQLAGHRSVFPLKGLPRFACQAARSRPFLP